MPVSIEPIERRCLMAAGILDESFAPGAVTAGVAVDDVPGGNNQVVDVAATGRGGAVVVSTFRPRAGKPPRLMVHVFRGDGSLETRFGTGGRLAMGAGPLGTEARAVAIQPDGKILVAAAIITPTVDPSGDNRRGDNGTIDGFPVNTFRDWGVIRFNTDGTRDRTFGTRGVAQFDVGRIHQSEDINVADIGSFALDDPSAIAVLPDGKVLVNGFAPFVTDNSSPGRVSIFENGEFAVLRLDPSGRLDTTFGESGRTTHGAGRAMAVTPDGSVTYVVGGKRTVFEDSAEVSDRSTITRLRADGTPDPQFGEAGTLTLTDSPTGLSSGDGGAGVQPNGKPVAGRVRLVRATLQGALDADFGPGDDGLADSGLLSGGVVENVLVREDGRIVVVGTKQTLRGEFPNQRTILDPVVARRLPHGAADASFGTDGRTLVSSGPNFDFVAGAFGRGGTVYAAGTRGGAVALARFTADEPPATASRAAMALGNDTPRMNPFGSRAIETDDDPAALRELFAL